MAEKGIWERILTETWPAKMARSAFDALMLPGDVYAGRVDPMSDEGIGKAADLAGLVMGGAYAAAPAMKNASGMGIKAYHGSPHDFDRFDLSKIGTGEGAQAYGHGLYFAEKEGVAKAYRDQLAKDMLYTRSGEMFDPQSQLQHLNVRVAAHRNGPDLDATITRAQELLPKVSTDSTRAMIEHDIAVLRKFKEAGGVEKQPGRMYEVDINAHPDQFLDWDKPLSAGAIDKFRAINPRAVEFAQARNSDVMGQDVYKAMGSPANTTDALREAGIPGIKYLDQGSRASGDGSRNYVVFDDKLINILRKYGLPATAGPIAALLAGGNSEAATAQ